MLFAIIVYHRLKSRTIFPILSTFVHGSFRISRKKFYAKYLYEQNRRISSRDLFHALNVATTLDILTLMTLCTLMTQRNYFAISTVSTLHSYCCFHKNPRRLQKPSSCFSVSHYKSNSRGIKRQRNYFAITYVST